MKNFVFAGVARFCVVAALAVSCNGLHDKLDSGLERTRLTIETRGEGQDPAVSLPVKIYVFGSGHCQAVQTMTSAEERIAVDLPEGIYDVFAVAGADGTDYDLPDKESATPESLVRLKEGKSHGDMMMSRAMNVVLLDGSENLVSLTFSRKVLKVYEVVIQNVPSAVSDVRVEFSPLMESITLEGIYSGENGSLSVPLQKRNGERVWESVSPVYSLPSAGNPVIKVFFSIGGNEDEYVFENTSPLVENTIVGIEGTYAGKIMVTMSGTLSGTPWDSENRITFDFGGE